MRNRQIILTLLIALVLPFLGTSQTRQLSLEEALSLAAKNNLSVKRAGAAEQAARAGYRISNAVFLPGLSVSYTGSSTNDPLAVFGYKLKQETATQADFDPELLNNPGSRENFNTRIELQQPLLNLDGIYARKAAKSEYEARKFQANYTGRYIRYEVKKAYYQLELAGQLVQVTEQALDAAREAMKLSQQNEQQGLVKKADVLETAVRLEERKNQLHEAINRDRAAGEYLAHLLGLEPGTPIELTDTLLREPARASTTTPSPLPENRPDLLAMQKGLEAREYLLQAQKMKFIPRLNAFGSYEWNDRGISGMDAANYRLGASLQWDLFSGYKNLGRVRQAGARLEEARLEYQDYLSQSQIRLNQARRRADLNYRRVHSGRLASEQAAESLRIRTNRYREGLEKTADLLQAEALAAMKKLEYLQAVYQYRESLFELEMLLEENSDK
ncbi:MAG: TolC family protein [Mangrovibacterium sp.]